MQDNAIPVPQLADFWFIRDGTGLAYHGHLVISCNNILELHHHFHKASNHPIISKLMFTFYLQCPLNVNGLIHGM